MMLKLKILLLGPCRAGKTTIANYISEAIDNPETEYHPTQGVRIIEYESLNPINNQRTEVELWDCSGDSKYDSCWPAYIQGVHGVIVTLDPSRTDHIRYIEKLDGNFSNMSNEQFLLLMYSPGNNTTNKLPGMWGRVHQIKVDLREGGGNLRREITAFISQISDAAKANNDREELSLLGLR